MISAGFEPATSSESPNDPNREPELLRRRANQLRQETVAASFKPLYIKPVLESLFVRRSGQRKQASKSPRSGLNAGQLQDLSDRAW